MHWVVVEDVSWPELGQRFGSHHETAKERAIRAIKRLRIG